MANAETTRPGGEPDHGEEGSDQTDGSPFADETSSSAEEVPHENATEIGRDGELALGDDDVRLPWLEGADDEHEEPGYNSVQVAAYLVMGLVALALIVGAIYWFTRSGPDDALIADGGIVPAPEEPYKQRPDDPGGKMFDGTGDSSFAVSEGQSRPAQLGVGASPQPGFETVAATDQPEASPSPAASSTPSASTEPEAQGASAAVSGPGVQVGAYNTRADAEAGWSKLTQQYSVLGEVRHRVVEGKAEIGTVYRLQAVPGDLAAAKALCRQLQSSGLNCYVKQ